ncbi:MAG TPA: hypothetical protein VJS30_11910 [Paraburkholderia sp.]|nr:hypothetical protein [Paraburkholderia sp.]
MNLQDQIGALDAGVDQLIQAISAALAPHTVVAAAPEQTRAAEVAGPEVAAQQAEAGPDTPAVAAVHPHEPQAADVKVDAELEADAVAAQNGAAEVTPEVASEVTPEIAPDAGQPVQEAEARKVTLEVGRPAQNEITMTIGGQTVSLHPLQVGQLIEELANARASMQPEPPPTLPPGWRFASTKNPMMAVQKQSNGDRLLVVRHTGHGWVPFVFSPDMVVQMYMMLTQR